MFSVRALFVAGADRASKYTSEQFQRPMSGSRNRKDEQIDPLRPLRTFFLTPFGIEQRSILGIECPCACIRIHSANVLLKRRKKMII